MGVSGVLDKLDMLKTVFNGYCSRDHNSKRSRRAFGEVTKGLRDIIVCHPVVKNGALQSTTVFDL